MIAELMLANSINYEAPHYELTDTLRYLFYIIHDGGGDDDTDDDDDRRKMTLLLLMVMDILGFRVTGERYLQVSCVFHFVFYGIIIIVKD
jgi:hypothetical protein